MSLNLNDIPIGGGASLRSRNTIDYYDPCQSFARTFFTVKTTQLFPLFLLSVTPVWVTCAR